MVSFPFPPSILPPDYYPGFLACIFMCSFRGPHVNLTYSLLLHSYRCWIEPLKFLTRVYLWWHTIPVDCGSDHEFLVAKFRLKLKKVGKTTRPFRYDLNQIPYDYTVELRNRFKGLDLIDRVPDELCGIRFVTLYRRQGSRPSPWKRNAKKQNGCLGRPYK